MRAPERRAATNGSLICWSCMRPCFLALSIRTSALYSVVWPKICLSIALLHMLAIFLFLKHRTRSWRRQPCPSGSKSSKWTEFLPRIPTLWLSIMSTMERKFFFPRRREEEGRNKRYKKKKNNSQTVLMIWDIVIFFYV